MKDIDLDKIFNDFDFEEEDEVKKEETTGNTGCGAGTCGISGRSGTSSSWIKSNDWFNDWMNFTTLPPTRSRGYIHHYDTHWIKPNIPKRKKSNQQKNNSKYDKPKSTTNIFNDEEKLKPQHYSYKNNYKGKL